MQTKFVMTSSAVIMGTAGILLTFIPDIVANSLDLAMNNTVIFLFQILGSLYFAFGMLNWMTKTSLIGGIYNRPIAVANFAHFLIAGLALAKGIMANPDLPLTLWVVGIVYIVYAVSFGIIMFRHPLPENATTA